jgi:hypothetical protein
LFLVYFLFFKKKKKEKEKKKEMNNVYKENKCSELRVECIALRDKSFQLIAARSIPTHFSHTYKNKCSDLRAECIELCDKSFQLIAARSTPTHFPHTYENKCSDLRAVFTALESVVQHFPTAHIDDIGKRFSQFKEARVAHTQLPDTHPLYKRCSYCYSPYHKREECPFILDYLVDEDEIVDNEEEHTKQVEHAQVTTKLESEETVDNNEEQVEQIERVEHHEKSQPPTDPNLPSDMEVSTEAPACIIWHQTIDTQFFNDDVAHHRDEVLCRRGIVLHNERTEGSK